jgi:hypothetical protein
MHKHPPPSARRLRIAAELRAAGNAWERVAAAVRLPLAEVRAWPHRFPARWRKAFARAERQAVVAATAEAVELLRRQLRSDDPKVVREASMKLVQIRVALRRGRRKPETQKPSDTPPGYADRLLAYVRGMTDEELAAAAAAGSTRTQAPD